MSTGPSYPLPPYVYKILPEPPPSPLPSALPLSSLDRTDGFIHLSTAAQTPLTASLFFTSLPVLWLLKIDARKTVSAGGVYRWVDGLPGCPHLYAPNAGEWIDLGSANVLASAEVRRAEGQEWPDALKGLAEDGWLVDE